MLQMLIIAACIIVHLGDEVHRTTTDPRWFLAYVGGLAIMAILVQLICWRARVRMDRVGWGYARHAADRAILLSRVACVLLHAAAVLWLGELAWIRAEFGNYILLDEAACVLPVVAFFAAGWWSIYPLERRVREAMLYRELHTASEVPALLSRRAFVWARMREGLGIALIPIGLATTSLEVLDRFGEPAIQGLVKGTSLASSASSIQAIASTLVVLCVLAVAPALVRFAWDLVPLPDGGTRGAIASIMARRKIRVVGPLVWRTGGESVNAAILGAVFPFRYMVFTDALLANLPMRQLQAVTAHEIAHVRLHHMPWIMVCLFASVYAIGWVASLGAWAMGQSIESDAATMWLSLAILLPIAWIFGVVSRRMEWQADAYAAKVLAEILPDQSPEQSTAPSIAQSTAQPAFATVTFAGPGLANAALELVPPAAGAPAFVPSAFASSAFASPAFATPREPGTISLEAASAVAGALQTVAELNAMDPAAKSFRHGSILTRQRRVLALAGKDPAALPIDRTVRLVKLAAISAIVLSGAVHVVATVL